MAYIHYSFADANTTITCVLTHQFIEVFIRTIPYSLTVILCALNVLLAVISTLLNLLILAAIISTPKLHKPSFVLLGNLALTDFAVGITFGPIEVAYLIARAEGQYSSFCTIWKILLISGYFLCSASLYTVTAISYDRYLSVSMSVKYRTIVTKTRAYYTVIIIWVSSVLGISIIGILGNEAFLVLVTCVVMLNLFVIVDCYLLSFAAMKQQKTESRPMSLAIKSKSEPNLCDPQIDNRLSVMLKRLSDYEEKSSGLLDGRKAKELEEPGNQEQKPSSWTRNNHLAVLEVERESKTERSKLDNVLVNMDSEISVKVSKNEEKHARRLHLESKMNELDQLINESHTNKVKRGTSLGRQYSRRSEKPTFYRIDGQSFKNSQHTILIIVISLFLCYLPFLVVSILISSNVINSGVSTNIAAIMFYMNSSINAVIMCTRISSIRHSCCKVIRKICNRNK